MHVYKPPPSLPPFFPRMYCTVLYCTVLYFTPRCVLMSSKSKTHIRLLSTSLKSFILLMPMYALLADKDIVNILHLSLCLSHIISFCLSFSVLPFLLRFLYFSFSIAFPFFLPAHHMQRAYRPSWAHARVHVTPWTSTWTWASRAADEEQCRRRAVEWPW